MTPDPNFSVGNEPAAMSTILVSDVTKTER